MEANERVEKEGWLQLMTGYHEDYLSSISDEELNKIYYLNMPRPEELQ